MIVTIEIQSQIPIQIVIVFILCVCVLFFMGEIEFLRSFDVRRTF